MSQITALDNVEPYSWQYDANRNILYVAYVEGYEAGGFCSFDFKSWNVSFINADNEIDDLVLIR